MTMPDWLFAKLVKDGTITPGGITRKAKPRRCQCGVLLLAGLDHPTTCARECRVDPVALNPLGEALARVEGRYTVSLNSEGGAWVLNERYDLQIADKPAGTGRREDILRQHRCGTYVPPELAAPSTFPESRSPLPADAPAPF